MNEIARARRQRLTVHRFASLADADRASRNDWRRLSAAERVLEVWRLSVEQWRLRRGGTTDEPGLCRSVARVRRG